MSSLSSEASLIVATFQLLAVQAVTGAARAADIESGDVVTPSGIVEQPQRRFLDSDTFTSSAAGGERDVIYTRDGGRSAPNETQEISRAEPKLIARPDSLHRCDPCVVPLIPNPPANSLPISPIEPPWKVLPWMDSYFRGVASANWRAKELVKLQQMMTDSATSGVSDRGGVLNIVI